MSSAPHISVWYGRAVNRLGYQWVQLNGRIVGCITGDGELNNVFKMRLANGRYRATMSPQDYETARDAAFGYCEAMSNDPDTGSDLGTAR